MEVGELIKGGYTIENTGEEFEALIITSVSTEDKKNDCIGKSKRINFKDTTGLLFGIYYDSGITNCQQKWYKLAGKYVYEIYLFDCKDITEIEGECDTSVDIDDIINKLEPLAYDKHELTVTGNDWASECEIDEDCTSTCENCDLGTYECNNGMCMECSSFVDCNDGFRCSDYVCVEMG